MNERLINFASGRDISQSHEVLMRGDEIEVSL